HFGTSKRFDLPGREAWQGACQRRGAWMSSEPCPPEFSNSYIIDDDVLGRLLLTRRGLSSKTCIMHNDAQMTLGQLAEVRPGHPFRGGIPEVPQGEVRVIQIGDLS